MQKIPLTLEGYEKLQLDLKDLKEIQRPNIIKDIAEARAHGDLSENAEYHSAREKQSFIEGKIKDLESIIGLSDVINPKKIKSSIIQFGASVTIVDCENNVESQYQIVGEIESNIQLKKISFSSPLARSLIGNEVGDIIDFNTPGGSKQYEILKVKYV